MAKFIGVIVGYLFGGFLGAVLGYFVGGMFGRGLRDSVREGYTLHSQGPDIFFETVFSLLGHMAKADGRVSEEEIAQAEVLMGKTGIREDARGEAIAMFKRGVDADYDMHVALSRFAGAARFRADLKQNLMMFLVEMAMADGQLHAKEEEILRRVAQAINIDSRSFEKMLDMLKAQHSFSGFGQRAASANDLAEAYKALGVDSKATDKEVKRAYRKLMSQYHPDKMIAKGVPEDMLAMATEKAQEVQAAYDVIEKSRK